MRFTLSCVYWTLLLISVVSSCLLFIIVASEGIKASKDASAEMEKAEKRRAAINISDEENDGENTNPSLTFSSRTETWDRKKSTDDFVESENKIENFEDQQEAPNLYAGVTTAAEKLGKYLPESKIFADVSTQQPNLSQGIPESDQAVVLTLVDAAAAELQSLAEPGLTLDNRGSKSVIGNLSLSVSSSAGVAESTEKAFQTEKNFSVDEKLLVDDKAEAEAEVSSRGDEKLVVIVRADQSGGARGITEGLPPLEETMQPSTTKEELDSPVDLLPAEYEARVRLSGSGSVDEAAIALDVLVPQTGTDPHEDIPSFSEWAQKRLEEAEKKKSHPNASSQNPGGPGGRGTGSTKVRSKNYASPDCGAKIVAANPEAGSASSVLSSSRDEYMLNTCTSRVWFVVELCEAIQAEKIELANFELFSSSPREFSVFVGDRFPSRDWSAVGQFSARDERDIQSFALDPRLFGKFVKVELHSHYGSEHFCPVSLFRVYGTSEFEVLETENQIQESLDDSDDDDDEEETLDSGDGADPPRNLFGSARDAVLSIVKKAAEVLVKSGDAAGNASQTQIDSEKDFLGDSLATTCGTPRFSILCDDCAEPTSAEAFRLLSCQERLLATLLSSDFINKTLSRGDVCASLGVRAFQTDATFTRNYPPARFLAAIFPPGHLVALCNVFVARENRAVVNESFYVTGNSSEAAAAVEDASIAPPHGVYTGCESRSTMSATQQPVYCTTEAGGASTTARKTPSTPLEKLRSDEDSSTVTSDDDATTISEDLASLIKPTKTLERDEGSRRESPAPPALEPSRKPTDESAFLDPPTTVSPIPSHQATAIDEVPEDPTTQGTSSESVSQAATAATDAVPESGDVSVGDADVVESTTVEPESETDVERDQEGKISSQDQLSLDTLLSDLKDLEADGATLQSNPATPSATLSQPQQPTPQQKESVFLRLSNRIKTLERNMSLSGQYLEELSKRYKKQVEEMQRSLERAIAAMGEESRRGEEREARRVEEVLYLREQVSVLSRSLGALLNDRDSWKGKFSLIGQHVVLVCVEIVIVLMVSSYCRRGGDLEDDEDVETDEKVEPKRRKSVEAPSAKRIIKKRRPSEIAVHVAGTSYRELLIDDEVAVKRGDKRRKRRREPVVTISNSRTVRSVPKNNFAEIPGGTNLPSRRASSSDAGKDPEVNFRGEDLRRRPLSAPETTDGWFSDQKASGKVAVADPEAAEDSREEDRSVITEEEEISSENRGRDHGIEDLIERKPSPEPGRQTGGGILKNKRLASPPFMKTALGSRRKRNPSGVESARGALLKSDNWEWYSKNCESKSSQEDIIVKESPTTASKLGKLKKPTTTNAAAETMNGFSSRNGRHEDSEDSESRSVTPSSVSPKEKKSYGIKKMVKKLF